MAGVGEQRAARNSDIRSDAPTTSSPAMGSFGR